MDLPRPPLYAHSSGIVALQPTSGYSANARFCSVGSSMTCISAGSPPVAMGSSAEYATRCLRSFTTCSVSTIQGARMPQSQNAVRAVTSANVSQNSPRRRMWSYAYSRHRHTNSVNSTFISCARNSP